MTVDVILSRKEHKYVAKVKEWPDVFAEALTRSEALRQVGMRLVNYLTHQVEVVQIEVDATPRRNPWLDQFGRFKDDPTFDDLQAEIAAYRQEIDKIVEKPSE